MFDNQSYLGGLSSHVPDVGLVCFLSTNHERQSGFIDSVRGNVGRYESTQQRELEVPILLATNSSVHGRHHKAMSKCWQTVRARVSIERNECNMAFARGTHMESGCVLDHRIHRSSTACKTLSWSTSTQIASCPPAGNIESERASPQQHIRTHDHTSRHSSK